MDSNELIKMLENNGCYNDKKKTIKNLYAVVDSGSFFKDQTTNRLNAGWKTAEYIIVNDLDETKFNKFIENWKNLASAFNDQKLLVYNDKKRRYSVYDGLGNYIGDETSIFNQSIATEKKQFNKIFYGVPGVGKSYRIKQAEDSFEQEKTVFHPEYTNADFVGQLLPVRHKNVNNSTMDISDGVDSNKSSISYEFVPGPFSRILKKALKNQDNKDKKYMLVIDEINRGNAAAIFGEIFQLLDRDESGKSEFGISNKDIYDYLIAKDENGDGVDESLLPDGKIYLPSNLYIWATMNTSDQNVYTLDTAFQRRWQMEMLTIDFDKDDETKAQGETLIPNSKYNLMWKEFVKAINDEISMRNEGMISVEDKRIGPWFAKKNEIEDIKLFTQKVIKYLWDDAFKMSRTEVFKDVKTLDEIVDKINKGSNIEDIFNQEIFEKVLNNRNVNNKDNQKTEIEDTNE